MIHLFRPTDQTLQRFLQSQGDLEFTYPDVGLTTELAQDRSLPPPPGFVLDRTRRTLGEGDGDFEAARASLAKWTQFDLGWVHAWPTNVPPTSGACVCVAARVLGCWILNAARIIEVFDTCGNGGRRFGFHYGTLPGHVEMGEERFEVTMDSEGVVQYEILAFSRPRHPLVKCGRPLARRLQKRFGRESCEAMAKAVRT